MKVGGTSAGSLVVVEKRREERPIIICVGGVVMENFVRGLPGNVLERVCDDSSTML